MVEVEVGKAVRCAEEFLEYVLSHREEFLANVARGDGVLKITTASIEHFVRDRCMPNGWCAKPASIRTSTGT